MSKFLILLLLAGSTGCQSIRYVCLTEHITRSDQVINEVLYFERKSFQNGMEKERAIEKLEKELLAQQNDLYLERSKLMLLRPTIKLLSEYQLSITHLVQFKLLTLNSPPISGSSKTNYQPVLHKYIESRAGLEAAFKRSFRKSPTEWDTRKCPCRFRQ